ncbi:MAG: hypothetical protein MUO23_13045 [Anaerolineales bacterium]|nr:hypothetical protein [Anaerolineales bacterium]
MDFGEVLTRTWQITWRYKGLWVLGLLAGCGTGGGGGGGGGGSSSYTTPGQQLGGIEQRLLEIPVWVWVVVAVLALILLLVFLVLGIIGTGGLIAGFRQADEGRDVTLGQAFRLGMKSFWLLLGFRLLLGLFGILLALILVVAAVGSLGFCLVPLICLGLPLVFGLGVYVSLCQVSLIDDDQRTMAAFRRGWEVLRVRPGPALLMGLILIGGGLVVSLILAMPILLLLVPLFLALSSPEQSGMAGGLLISGLCFLGYLPVLLLVNAVVQTYLNGAWTLTYRRLTGKAAGGAALAEFAIPLPG